MTSYQYPPKSISLPLSEIAKKLSLSSAGNSSREISGLCSADEPIKDAITFLSGETRYLKKLPSLLEAKIGAIILSEEFYKSEKALRELPKELGLIFTQKPKETFFELIPFFYSEKKRASGVIHPSAIIPTSCNIHSSVDIGAYTVLGEDISIGEGSIIFPHTVIYDGCTIGKFCTVHSGATFREGVTLGDFCTIQNLSLIHI